VGGVALSQLVLAMGMTAFVLVTLRNVGFVQWRLEKQQRYATLKTRSCKPQDWRFRMSVILCAIRGGPECQPTIAQAITLAQETGLPVHFLYVVNRGLLSTANGAQARAISGQIRQMGRSVLRTALAWASAEDVTAQGVIRQGNVGDEIAGLCRDLEADYLVVGRPQLHEERNVFSEAQLPELIEQIEQQTGAEVVPLDGDGR
jgi:nucleotide-binding universal stress UspA family protein